MTTLEDLYYGNISPHEMYIKRGTRVDKLVMESKVKKIIILPMCAKPSEKAIGAAQLMR